MKIDEKFWYRFSVISILIFVMIVLIIKINWSKNFKLVERSSVVQARINRITPNHGSSYILLDNKEKILIPQINNYKYTPSCFCELASIGDSISKEFDNDTILLFKKDKVYIFRLGKALNVP